MTYKEFIGELEEELYINDEDIDKIKADLPEEFKDFKKEWLVKKDIKEFIIGLIVSILITRVGSIIYFISNAIKHGTDWSLFFLLGVFMSFILNRYVTIIHEKLHIWGMTTKNNRNDYDVVLMERNKFHNSLTKVTSGTINPKGWVMIGRNKFLLGLLLPGIVLTLIPLLICFPFYNVKLCVIICGFALAHSLGLIADINSAYNTFKNTKPHDVLLQGPVELVKGQLVKIPKELI